ncbi:transposase [Pseudidiomarina mangrovi]|uniref:transposase n=1 Tax=Pseudidiomarina mangrovi TaxID=2487133 RepID=UPI000FCB1A0F|nr:transposase [Pseudidiomarina mangrovi]
MPRKLRKVRAGQSYHVYDRGNNKQRIFFNTVDYKVFLEKAFVAAEKHHVLIHAYALMPNHFHFFVTATSHYCVSIFMRALKGGYSQWFNRRKKRTGTLWETRFNAVLVDSVRYALVLYRYIELNPVRGGLVVRPSLWPWSSILFNARGVEQEGLVLTPHPVYSLLGSSAADRQAKYRRFVAEAGGQQKSLYEASCVLIEQAQERLAVLGDSTFLAQAIVRDQQNYESALQVAFGLYPDLLDGLAGYDELRLALASAKGQALKDASGAVILDAEGEPVVAGRRERRRPLKGPPLKGQALSAKGQALKVDAGVGADADMDAGMALDADAVDAAAPEVTPTPEHLLHAMRMLLGLVRGFE